MPYGLISMRLQPGENGIDLRHTMIVRVLRPPVMRNASEYPTNRGAGTVRLLTLLLMSKFIIIGRLGTKEFNLCLSAYLQSTLTLSTNAVMVPFALKVIWNVLCSSKLLPVPGPVQRKLLTKVSS